MAWHIRKSVELPVGKEDQDYLWRGKERINHVYRDTSPYYELFSREYIHCPHISILNH